jgi:hypothetical protein
MNVKQPAKFERLATDMIDVAHFCGARDKIAIIRLVDRPSRYHRKADRAEEGKKIESCMRKHHQLSSEM